MSDPQDKQTNKGLQQLQANEDVPRTENAEAIIHVSEEQIQGVDTNGDVREEENGNSIVDIPPEIDSRCIYKVSRHLQANREQVYVPVVVSLGPYHHGKQELREMEKFKEEELNLFMADSRAEDPTKGPDFYYGKIMENIEEIRANYEKVEYSDEKLAKIILRDACFLMRVLDGQSPFRLFNSCEHLGGFPTVVLMMRDLYMLENQIPFWIIKYLFNLRPTKGDADQLLYDFLNIDSDLLSDNQLPQQPPWKGRHQLLHVLHAQHIVLVHDEGTKSSTEKNYPETTSPIAYRKILYKLKVILTTKLWKSTGTSYERMRFRMLERRRFGMSHFSSSSVTELQSKGIHFRPSSRCLKAIHFTSYNFSGMLDLPIMIINDSTKVMLSNIIAFELSSGDGWGNGYILSYINFMKLLINTSKDVKELRTRGILYYFIENDEEVVNIFKEIETYRMSNIGHFEIVKRKIALHCNSKTKTKTKMWMTDLINTHFRSPWTVIAIIAATFVLCLTFLQTFYAIHPVK